MDGVKTILAVVSDRDDGEIVLEKAVHMARANGAALHVIKIVYEGFVELSGHGADQREALKAWVMQSEEAFLEDLIDPWRNQIAHLESATMWHRSQWEGILEMASQLRADFVIKPTRYPVTEVIRTPQDWSLLRHAEIPVMLVKPINWSDKPRIAAAIDASDDAEEELNLHILRQTGRLASSFGARVHVFSAFPSVEHWIGPITVAIDFDQVREATSNQIKHKIHQLAESCDVKIDAVHALEGEPGEVIKKEVDQLNIEVLVMGTHARKGPSGKILGNTSESIIHQVNSDVVVLR
ncbi:MAG: universal stress protein [Pseudomonadales bacterium]